MLQQELLTQVLEVLHLEKITYMITGPWFQVCRVNPEPNTILICFAQLSVVMKCDALPEDIHCSVGVQHASGLQKDEHTTLPLLNAISQ
jgi:hypothetical protein